MKKVLRTRSHYEILDSKEERKFLSFITAYSEILFKMDLSILQSEKFNRDDDVQISIIRTMWTKYQKRDINSVMYLLRNGCSKEDIEQNTCISKNIIVAAAEAMEQNKQEGEVSDSTDVMEFGHDALARIV